MKDLLEPWVPAINTSLIVISGAFLLSGYFIIRRRDWPFERRMALHKRCMLTASVFAGLFLVVYVTRALVYETKLFAGEGWVRVAYLAILISHIILATAIVPFVLVTLRRAFRGDYPRHRRIARPTFGIWLYVVVTGWVIYLMLYKL